MGHDGLRKNSVSRMIEDHEQYCWRTTHSPGLCGQSALRRTGFLDFFENFFQELRMLKKAAALALVGASLTMWVGCTSNSSQYLYATIPASNQIVAFREDQIGRAHV